MRVCRIVSLNVRTLANPAAKATWVIGMPVSVRSWRASRARRERAMTRTSAHTVAPPSSSPSCPYLLHATRHADLGGVAVAKS